MPNLHWGSNYSFAPYTVKHAVVLLTLVALATLLVAVGRRLEPVRRRAFERAGGLMLAGMWLCGGTWDFINPRGSASTTLPLHWCDLTGALAIVVIFAPQYRVPRALLHFWSLCICSFAFFVPAIGLGPMFADFWFYFGTHAALVLAAVYDRGVRGFVPTRRDLAWAWGMAAVVTLLLQPVNLALQSNYGFVGASDVNVRKAIRAMGAWPWRLGPMLAVTFALMVALMLVEAAIASVYRKLFASRPPRDERTIPFPMQTEASLSNAA